MYQLTDRETLDTDDAFLYDAESFDLYFRMEEEDPFDIDNDNDTFHLLMRPPYIFSLSDEYYDVSFFLMFVLIILCAYFGLIIFIIYLFLCQYFEFQMIATKTYGL